MKSVLKLVLSLLLFSAVLPAQVNMPVPFVEQPLVPATVAPGSGQFVLTVNGANFVNGAQVQWNGVLRLTHFVSSTRLTANISATQVATAGTASIQVVNPGTSKRTSNVVYFPIGTARSQMSFTQNALPSNGDPNALVAADLNNNGILDLAVCKDATGKVSIFPGTGGGQFGTAKDYQIAPTSGCVSIVAADFNGDKHLDLAASNSTTIAILMGRGNGTFMPATQVTVGMNPKNIAVADLNADGNLDLAVANFDSGTISILLGNGDGTFQGHADYPVDAGSQGVTIGDFNGDGKLDLVVASERTNNASFLQGNGDGTFQNPVTYGAGVNSSFVSSADFNGDGKLDIVVSDLNPLSYPISVLLGNGDGTFKTRTGSPAMAYGTPALADLNGDGFLDVALTYNSGVAVMTGKGDGHFLAPVTFDTTTANAVTIVDFNNDGLLDMAVGGYTSGQVVILLQAP